jgi:hypothetical protein
VEIAVLAGAGPGVPKGNPGLGDPAVFFKPTDSAPARTSHSIVRESSFS